MSMPEALRLAYELEQGDTYESHPSVVYGWHVGGDDPTTQAAAELRRLHARAESAEAERDRLCEQKDGAYLERNRCVALIARMAIALGHRVAVTKTAIEGWSEDWHGCIYIDLPTGQVSWHFHDSQAELFADLPRGDATWDGHDTPEKYRRVMAAFLDTIDAAMAAKEPR
jgi:hypothetical protein